MPGRSAADRQVGVWAMLAVLLVLAAVGCSRRPAPPAPARRPPVAPPPAPVARELCGNCADDDGDDLADDEDTDCCSRPVELSGVAITLDPAVGAASRVTLSARLPPAGAAETTPLVDDVGVQVRAGSHAVLCATLGHQYWVAEGRSFRFRVRTVRGGGAPPEALLRVLPDGAVAVRVSGRHDGTAPLAAGAWRVAVRIGDRCGVGRVRPDAAQR